MAALTFRIRTAILLLLGCVTTCVPCRAQNGPEASPPTQSATSIPADKPIPDIATLMRAVEANQRRSESVEKDYIYHSIETAQEANSHGQTKKTTITEYDIYWVNGARVRRMVKKNGKDLSPQELAKEDDRIQKESAKAREKRQKGDAQGKETDARGNEEVTVSRLLELGAFTNARRVQLNGRDTIAVDFTGDPKAKTRNRAEDVIRDLAGTAWIDEQDHVLARVEGRFVDAFKIGAGLIASIQKDTRFSMEQTKINDEVWLPARLDGQGSVRALLFISFNGSGHIVNSDYRKFRATATVLPGMTQVDPPQADDAPTQP